MDDKDVRENFVPRDFRFKVILGDVVSCVAGVAESETADRSTLGLFRLSLESSLPKLHRDRISLSITC